MADLSARRGLLARYAVFGSAIAFAGPPIYIHAPAFYSQIHGLDLAVAGGVLLAVRAIDFVQDPLLGHVVARHPARRRLLAGVFAAVLAAGMVGLFAPVSPVHAAIWLAVTSVVVFTGFSGLQILFYSAGVGLADASHGGHARIAAWREAGVFAGVCAAAAAPTILSDDPRVSYSIYAVLFAVFLTAASMAARPVWRVRESAPQETSSFSALVRDRPLRALFGVGLLNTLPVGLTSTLFLFYVNDRLQAPAHAGPLLLTFFLAAGVAAPMWGRVGARIGLRRALLVGMPLAIIAFSFALPLSAGDWPAFYAIAALSGAAISADLTLLPALLSERLARMGASGGYAFGLWGFLTKASLALAAGTALPLLSVAGYTPGAPGDAEALRALTFAYAGAPCALKVLAIIAIARAPLERGTAS